MEPCTFRQKRAALNEGRLPLGLLNDADIGPEGADEKPTRTLTPALKSSGLPSPSAVEGDRGGVACGDSFVEVVDVDVRVR